MKRDWSEAAERLGLNVVHRSPFRRRPTRLTGSAGPLVVEVKLVDKVDQGAFTRYFVGFPEGPWDTHRVTVRMARGNEPATVTAVAGRLRDRAFLVKLPRRRGSSAAWDWVHEYLTRERRSTFSDLQSEVPSVRLEMGTSGSSLPTKSGLRAKTAGRADAATVIATVERMVACATALTAD